MKKNWKATAAGLAVLIGLSGAAFGADRDHDANRNNDRNRAPVVQRDRNDHNMIVRHDGDDWKRDRRVAAPVYREPVYRAPVYSAPVYRGPVYTTPYYGYGNQGYYGGNNGYYGNNAGYASNAQQIGYQDGLNDGRNDSMTGHSFRPTHDDNYRNATRGFNGYGSEQAYKDTYRIGYEQGYQQGYGR